MSKKSARRSCHYQVRQATIDIHTGKLTSPLRTISKGMVTDVAEEPHLYKINEWYYLIEAECGTRFLHMEAVGRSKSPWGSFAPDPANPFVAQYISWAYPVKSVGHCDWTDTPEGKWWIVGVRTRQTMPVLAWAAKPSLSDAVARRLARGEAG